MLPGEYEFSTGAKELMEILSGELDTLLPGASAWTSYGPGSAFEVPGQSSFKVRVKTLTDYCCSFIN